MVNGNEIFQKGLPHLGERYIFGAFAPKNNANWAGPWDCAEFVSWCVFQTAGKLYGCANNGGNPSGAAGDAYTGYWKRDASGGTVTKISLAKAARTPGAILLRNPAANAIGHIVISDGMGGTVEAKGAAFGVVRDTLDNRRWDTGILLPGVNYIENAGGGPVTAPAQILRLKSPQMKGPRVKDVQRKLKELNISPGPIDGSYGPMTVAAVVAFQQIQGLVADGEVGPATAQKLGLDPAAFS